MENRPWVVFRLDGWSYAVPVDRVREIVRPLPVVRMPKVARFVRGLFNLRGQVLPLVDVRSRLGLPADVGVDGRARIVVAETGAAAYGLAVDEVQEVVRCPDGALQVPDRALDLPDGRFVSAVLDFDGRIILVLDLERLVEGAARGGGE